jgi:ectoine hydroxylase-related dioxygenase (phytanoyl-CoA dioxygenase family)
MEKHFKDDGFVVINNFFNNETIEEVKQAITSFDNYELLRDRDVVWEGDVEDRDYKYIQNINYYVPACHKVLTNRLFDVVSKLLEEEVYFVNMEIHNKVPFKGSITPMHQDNFYFQLSPPSTLTAYIPLEIHSADINGGLQFLKATNHLGTLNHSSSKVKAFSSLLELDNPEEYELFKTDLNAGDIVFHHGNTVHFADENKSEHHRRSLSLRFNGVSAKIDPNIREQYKKNYQVNRERELEETN